MFNRFSDFFKKLTDSCRPDEDHRFICSVPPPPPKDYIFHKIILVSLQEQNSLIRKNFNTIFVPNQNVDEKICGAGFFKYELQKGQKTKYQFWELLKQEQSAIEYIFGSYFRGSKTVLCCIDDTTDFAKLESLLQMANLNMEKEALLFTVFDPLKKDAEKIYDEAKKRGYIPIPMFSDKTKDDFLKAVTEYNKENAEAYYTAWANDEPMKYSPEKYQSILKLLQQPEYGFPTEISALIGSHLRHQLPDRFFSPSGLKDGNTQPATTAAAATTTAPVPK